MRKIFLTVVLAMLATGTGWAQESGAAVTGRAVAMAGHDAGGHSFNIEADRGKVVAIVMLSRYTSKAAAPIQDALGPLTKTGKVDVISVVDMIGIPGMFRGMAHKKVLAGARTSPMHFLVDDDGALRTYFGAHPDKRVDILVIDATGVLRGHFMGQEQLGAAEQMIHELSP